MKIEHHFLTTSPHVIELFEGVTKFNTFCSRLEKHAELNIDRYPRDKYVGDGFNV